MLISNNHTQSNKELKILIVEDEITSRKSIELFLRVKFNCEVCSVRTGEEGIAIAAEVTFSLIIMNIGLPGIDGISAAKIIRQSQSKNKKTPIIATSGISHEQKLLHKAGINAFLIKPFINSELEILIKKILLIE